MKPYLQTPRLILRPFNEADSESFARYRSDPQIAQYQGWEAPFSLEKAAHFIQGLQATEPGKPGIWYQLAIERHDSAGILGDVGFQILAEDPRQAEIGFTLAAKYQGHGYASEAVQALLAYLFLEHKLHRVRANCDPANTASARLLQRVGMRHEGRFIDSYWLKGQWVSEDWYAILEREWQNLNSLKPEQHASGSS